ncbi:MAG TPA: flavin reductase family protein [Syntrophomonadaceae bacterium]|nr:flavin reductase family protein [Syntrophomonadaceae bacterium]HPR93899.1 flavin reductase family protein [Syntrophomonadaceae bacterium]
MTKNIRYDEFMQETLAQLPRGAFLSVKADDKINTMTIGWGLIGFIWKMPVIMVAVRPSRYTFELMEKADNFSVSFPHYGDLKQPLAKAGQLSGRDIDKFAVFDITPQAGTVISSPSIAECNLVYECELIYKHPLDPALLNSEIKTSCYAENDYHTLYFGKIAAAYLNE